MSRQIQALAEPQTFHYKCLEVDAGTRMKQAVDPSI